MTNTPDLKTPAAVAAAWWAEAIGAPKFDNGDTSETGGMMALLAFMVAGEAPDANAANKFASLLAEKIESELQWGLTRQWSRCTIGVDYHPDHILSEAAEKAGVKGGRFPWKTMMWVSPDEVVVSAGYHGAHKLLWHAPDYVIPECGRAKWDDKLNLQLPYTCSKVRYHDGGNDHADREHRFDVPNPLCRRCNSPANGTYHTSDVPGFGHPFEEGPASSCDNCGMQQDGNEDRDCRRYHDTGYKVFPSHNFVLRPETVLTDKVA